jgi:hypothetical protein
MKLPLRALGGLTRAHEAGTNIGLLHCVRPCFERLQARSTPASAAWRELGIEHEGGVGLAVHCHGVSGDGGEVTEQRAAWGKDCHLESEVFPNDFSVD